MPPAHPHPYSVAYFDKEGNRVKIEFIELINFA
jgi:hypothetical protein